MCSGLKDFFFNTDTAIITVIISSCTLLIAILGGCFSLYQWNNSNKIKRAEFLLQMVEKLRFDEKMSSAMYLVDYKDNWYTGHFHGSEVENEIDRLFVYLSSILYLKDKRLIRKVEFNSIKYTINRVCSSISTQNYMWNIFHFSNKQKVTPSFHNLIQYALKEKYIKIEDDFFNPDSKCKKFRKFLNF